MDYHWTKFWKTEGMDGRCRRREVHEAVNCSSCRMQVHHWYWTRATARGGSGVGFKRIVASGEASDKRSFPHVLYGMTKMPHREVARLQGSPDTGLPPLSMWTRGPCYYKISSRNRASSTVHHRPINPFPYEWELGTFLSAVSLWIWAHFRQVKRLANWWGSGTFSLKHFENREH